MTEPQDVNPLEVEQLVRDGAARVLDVRTPGEYQGLGHIPGALLLPVDLIACAPAALLPDDRTLVVVCEHGVRSAHAARVLAAAGFEGVLNMAGGMSCWAGPREHAPPTPDAFVGPSTWLLAAGDLLPSSGDALDVACGRGRHALLLASVGWRVRAVDRDVETIAGLAQVAARLDLSLQAEVTDLESGEADLGREMYDLIVGFRYLHRPLFPALVEALRPGGLLVWETFTREQARSGGRPTRRSFLLEDGELEKLVAPLEVLRERAGEHEGRWVASVVARKS